MRVCLLLLALPLLADDCVHVSHCDRLTRFPVVFLGETVELKNGLARLRVITIFKGLLPGTTEQVIRVSQPAAYGDAAPYEAGHQTLVFTDQNLRDGPCSPSRFIAPNSAYLARFTRDLPHPPANSFTGQTVPGARIQLETDQTTAAIRAVTIAGPDGAFDFPNLPRGRYRIRATAPRYEEYRASLNFDGRCDNQYLHLTAKTLLRGRIVQPGGRPAPGILVYLSEWSMIQTLTARDGSFEFVRLPPAELHLRIGQGTHTEPSNLTKQFEQTNLQIEIPHLGPQRVIDVEVAFPSGQPAPNVEIGVSLPDIPFITRIRTDKFGKAFYLDLPGIQHTISIRGTPYQESIVPASSNDVKLRFTVPPSRKP